MAEKARGVEWRGPCHRAMPAGLIFVKIQGLRPHFGSLLGGETLNTGKSRDFGAEQARE